MKKNNDLILQVMMQEIKKELTIGKIHGVLNNVILVVEEDAIEMEEIVEDEEGKTLYGDNYLYFSYEVKEDGTIKYNLLRKMIGDSELRYFSDKHWESDSIRELLRNYDCDENFELIGKSID